jgi:hypothetical protein
MPKSYTLHTALICVAIAGPTLGATKSYDGTYSGELSLTAGEPRDCARDTSVIIIITGGTLKITNGAMRDFAMRFDPGSDGVFAGSIQAPSGALAEMRGEVVGTAIDADASNYGNGCGYHLHVEKNR